MIWEYQAISVEARGIWDKNLDKGHTVSELNKLGKDGWEVVAAFPIERTGNWTHEAMTTLLGSS